MAKAKHKRTKMCAQKSIPITFDAKRSACASIPISLRSIKPSMQRLQNQTRQKQAPCELSLTLERPAIIQKLTRRDKDKAECAGIAPFQTSECCAFSFLARNTGTRRCLLAIMKRKRASVFGGAGGGVSLGKESTGRQR
jgi:hypothetical protein